MSKIALIDPFGPRKAYFRHCHLLRDWSGAGTPGYIPIPSLDLLYTAAYLRKHGHEAKIIEASVKHWPHEKVAKNIKADNFDFALIPSSYYSLDDDKYLAKVIRENTPRIKIIFSGPWVTHDPSLVLSDNSADFVALGEYELPCLNIIRGDYSENIAYRDNGNVFCGKRKLVNMGELAIPARDLIDNRAYRYAVFNKRNPVTTMTISRGCPHSKCKFCHAFLFTLKEIRYRDIDSITEEINEIVFKYKIGEILFRDQAFTANRELVFKICEYMISNNIDIAWRVTTRVDLVDKELLALMHRAGCYQISFGFESSSQKSLDLNNKGITLEQSRLAARWAKEAGIEILGLFMLGMPGDTQDSMADLHKFALGLEVDYAQFNEVYLVPGVPLYDEYMKDKTILFPSDLIKKYAMLSYLKFYFRPGFILKQLGRIRSPGDLMFLMKVGVDAFLSYF